MNHTEPPWFAQRLAALDFECSDKVPETARIVSCALILVGGGLPAAAVDNVEGTNLADLDECELIFSLPARCPHREELKQRIADETVLRDAFGAIADGIDYDADLAAFADGLLREIRDEDDHTTNPTGEQS